MITNYITITIKNKTFKELSKIRGKLSWGGTIALLILSIDKIKFQSTLKEKKLYSTKGVGSHTLKLPLNSLYKELNKLRGYKEAEYNNQLTKKYRSMSVVLDTLMEIYDKEKFKEYKKIKLAGI